MDGRAEGRKGGRAEGRHGQTDCGWIEGSYKSSGTPYKLRLMHGAIDHPSKPQMTMDEMQIRNYNLPVSKVAFYWVLHFCTREKTNTELN